MGTSSVNIGGAPGQAPSLTFSTYIPAPSLPPPPAIPRPVVLCSDSLIRTVSARYKTVIRTTRARFVYSPAQADKVALRTLSLTNGLKDSRTVVVSLGLQVGIGQRVELDDGASRYLGAVYGIEINQTGRVVTKTLQLRRIYQ